MQLRDHTAPGHSSGITPPRDHTAPGHRAGITPRRVTALGSHCPSQAGAGPENLPKGTLENRSLESTWSHQHLLSSSETGPQELPLRPAVFRTEPIAGTLHIFGLTSKYHTEHGKAVTGQHCSDNKTFQLCHALCPDGFTRDGSRWGATLCTERDLAVIELGSM